VTARRLALAVLVGLASSLPWSRARAQAPTPRPPALTPELRLDGAIGREGGAFGGAGLFGDAGLYTRLGLVAVAGIAHDPTRLDAADRQGVLTPAARIEGIARFHLDPLRLSRRGTYLGGGVAALLVRGGAPRWQLVALLGIEGAPRGALAPALEVGLGGGVRVGVALRRARRGRR
jgi:hypothetical protein